MANSRKLKRPEVFAELLGLIEDRLQAPFGIVLGSPLEVVELVARLPAGPITCFQLDIYQAERLRLILLERGLTAKVVTSPDLWDLDPTFQTLLYPVPYGGERALKLDMVEQAFHVLVPQGLFVVLSPYDVDQFFPQCLKKIFGKVHTPMKAENALFWCLRTGERARRRHEVTFQVRVDDTSSMRFLSRPGVFSYGKFDEGARALIELAGIPTGASVLDLGCGGGCNGIIAAHHAGPQGFIGFIDSNVRAVALAEHNARELQVPRFQGVASSEGTGFPDHTFDVVLANPPYYAQSTIAQMFIERGRALLDPHGSFYLVTRQIEAIHPLVEVKFRNTEVYEHRHYYIIHANG